MIEYPLAVLKFTWSDTPWQGGRPLGLAYDDALVNRLFLPLARSWGVAGYWSQATFDLLNLEGSEVFPWRKLDNLPAPTPAGRYLREQVAGQAIRQAQAEEWPLDRFKGIVVMVAPRDPDSDAGATVVDRWPVCLVQMGDEQFFFAHEMGHVLGFEHTMGPDNSVTPPVLGSYNDPYCVMGDGTSCRPPMPLPPTGPPAGDNYWSWMAPLVSTASLCAFLPGFLADTRHVEHTGSLTGGFRRTLRLRARDLDRRGDTPYPVALVTSVPAGDFATGGLGQGSPPTPSAWVVELRRGAGSDRGLGRPGEATAGLVVHSLRHIDEFPSDGNPDFRSRAVYEGVLPLQPASPGAAELPDWTAGDADARFGNGVFTVRVEEVAPDLSWAEVTLGGALLGRESAIYGDFGRADGVEKEASEDGFAEHVPVFLCGFGDYRYTLSRRSARLKSVATAFGYDRPTFSWTVNGVAIPAVPPLAIKPAISVPVTAHDPQPNGGEVVLPRTARVRYEQESNQLILIGDPADGNYTLEIEVTVKEGAPQRREPGDDGDRHGHRQDERHRHHLRERLLRRPGSLRQADAGDRPSLLEEPPGRIPALLPDRRSGGHQAAGPRPDPAGPGEDRQRRPGGAGRRRSGVVGVQAARDWLI
jgi:hypothetical protein